MADLNELVSYAKEDLRDWVKENPKADRNEANEVIFDLADASVPVYTGELLQLALDNLDLAVVEPELGPAFDGKPTPVNLIAANIFEYIESALWQEWDAVKKLY